jgi:2-dehydro-3-deoxygluconokinase
MQPDIVAVGEPMLEFNATEEGLLADVDLFRVGYGGDTSNFAVAAARLGGSVGYLTALGSDPFGDRFMALWAAEGIDTSRVRRDPDAPTGIYFISRKGDRHEFTYYRNTSAASRMTAAALPMDYIRASRLLHVSGISQAISLSACDAVFSAVAAAREAGVRVSYDPNLRLKLWPVERARAVIHQTAAMADLVMPSYEDATALTGMTDPEAIARFYLSLGPAVVVLKLGADGALLAEKDGRGEAALRRFPAFAVSPVDMTGAGDTFDGAFVVAWLSGRPTEECVRFANAAGALTTTGLGAVTPIPTTSEVEAFMASAGPKGETAP